jgi:hypothetical protein
MAVNPVASAVPAYLYDYADQTTQRNDAVQKQLSNLANLIQAYRNGAIAFGNNIGYLTVPLGPGGGSDLTDLAQQTLPGIRTSDQGVHDVGAAFEAINRQGLRLTAGGQPPGADPYATTLAVTMDENEIDHFVTVVEPVERAGQSLAAYVEQHGFDDSAWQQILKYQKDPDYAYFAAGFLNTLAQLDARNHQNVLQQFLLLPGAAAGAPPHWADMMNLVVTAYHGDMLDPAVTAVVSQVLLGPNTHLSAMFRADFFHALEKDHQAAQSFVDTLTDDQLSRLLAGNYQIAGEQGNLFTNSLGQYKSQSEAEFIKVLTSGLTGYVDDPALAGTFYHRVTPLIQQTAPDDFGPIMPAVSDLVGTYFAAELPTSPPDATASQLDAWAKGSADLLSGDFRSWHDWIFRYEQQRQDARGNLINWTNFTVGVASGIVTTVVSMNPVIGIVAGAASSAATTWGVNWIFDRVDPFNGDPEHDSIQLRKQLARSLQYVATVDMLKNGQIIGPDGKPVPLSQSGIQAVLTHQQNYVIAGTRDVQLNYILDGIGNTVLNDE